MARRKPARARAAVLLVDDHPENLLALEAVLRPLGLEAVRAASGAEALKRVLERDFAVILLDVQMPGMDGFETAELIRRRERSQLTPIIFLTAVSRAEGQIDRGYASGAVDYILKPFSAEILRAKVSVFLELYRQRNEVSEQRERLRRTCLRLKRAEEGLRERSRELEASNAALSTFADYASHELEEPARKLLAFSELLRDQPGAVGPEGAEALRRIEGAARRMQRLVKDLLELARVGAGGLPAGNVDLDALLGELAAELRPRLGEAGAELRLGPLGAVPGEAGLLRQLFANLIGNALKFRRPEVPLEIMVDARGDGEGLVIRVADNGIGFEPRHAQRIMRPFQRLHGRDEYEGSGLGLAVCERIARRHGGTLTASGRPGEGAEFLVRLPAAGGVLPLPPPAGVPSGTPPRR